MPRKSPYRVILTVDEKKRLQSFTRKYTSQYRDIMRAKIVLPDRLNFEFIYFVQQGLKADLQYF